MVSDEKTAAEASRSPEPPDATAVNESWRAESPPGSGLRGLLERLLGRVLGPRFEAQRAFNARQVQLDNELLRYLEERLAATHRHYDRLLAGTGGRLEDVDERHRLLERELLRHVQDLVARIDLVLAEASREKLALAFELEETRARLARLEQALRPREG